MVRCLFALLMLFLFAPESHGAEPGGLRRATYEGLDVAPAVKQVRFEKRATRQGDRVDQAMQVSLALASTTREGEKVVESTERKMQRVQQRAVIIEEVARGRTMAVRVRFLKSQFTTNSGEPEPHLVVGKTYLCRRTEKGPLQITRDDGSLPNAEEHEVVAESMDSLGKPNPLADFLAGRTLAVGEKLELPNKIGGALLGSGGNLGEVSRFELTLLDVTQHEGTRVARFAADIEAQGDKTAQLRLAISGILEIEVDTCRTRRLELSGPLAMATSRGSYSQVRTTQMSGKLSVAMSATYTERE